MPRDFRWSRFPWLRGPAVLGAALAAAALAATLHATAADIERGRGLYELRCGGCHTDSVHGRERRVARDLDDIRGWVRRWNQHLRLSWGDDEIEDVAAFLNAAYYHFPCDSPECRATAIARGPTAR